MDVFRVKGILRLMGSAKKHIVQGVHELFEITESTEGWPSVDDALTQVIFIGRDLDRAVLQAGLDACKVAGGGPPAAVAVEG